MLEELICNPKGLWLGLERRWRDDSLELAFQLKGGANCVLHWGTASGPASQWQAPAPAFWPQGTSAHGQSAVQTPFQPGPDRYELVLRFPKDRVPPFLVFDLFSPQTNRWENNHGKDYWVALRESGPAPLTALDRAVSSVPGSETVQKRSWALDGGGDLAVAIRRGEQQTEVILASNLDGPLDLHWGIQDRARSAWKQPTVGHWPEGTVAFDEQAVRSRFLEREGLRWLTLRFPVGEEPPGIGFVLFQPESGRWAKHRGTDLFLRLAAAETPGVPLSDLMSAIVEGEMGPHGWTLMHRFNLCHDLIEEAGDNREAWATLFVWLRYSAIRQLDWQRNYNTKPRELAHAQDRLTARLAESYIRHPAQRDLIRLMLACVGRGGEGQRIRDDILHIMHRHHIKEVGGTWMEQWHQKLHNNTTPDDIVICQAYLAFLRGNGDLHAYDAVLLEGGVTRERLAGFERPITRDPEWHPQLKDGLIHDFENYLQLLRSVHAGTDLDTAAQAGGRLIEGRAFEALTFVQHRFRDPQVDAVELTTRITEARRGLVAGLGRMSDAAGVKDGLYLDLALEEALRTAIERQLQSKFGSHQLVALLGLVLDNLLLVEANVELDQCNREWRRLPLDQRFSRDWCLRAKAVVDRLRRAVEAVTDGTYQRLQPLAERLGGEFQAAPWTVTLFSEEIVRGRPLFLLSMLLHQLDPVLRKEAKLGDWQVISPSRVAGVVRVVAELRAVQGRKFDRPTVLVADVVRGDEEPPEGVRAVITPKSVDLVSHVAVRARNAGLLFATCFEDRIFKQLRELEGQHIELAVTGSGDVTFSKSEAVETAPARRRGVGPRSVQRPVPALRVLRRAEFEPGQVGGKSWRIRELAERVPEAFRTPRSVALPFGVFDAVLADPDNRESARQFQSLRAIVDSAPEARLPELRACILGLRVPQRLLDEIRVALRDEGVAVSADTDAMSQRIKQVWASLWNERAYFSRQANGLPHDSVSMAVLIQEVVEAQYAFVIHTVNPATSNREELYAEVVCGLGETLVGNHPGRALSFVVNKSTLQSTLLAYPSKSLGLRGGGLIFRSDSNAEDLEGYAGAGLYDSVLLVPAVEQVLDYTTDPLVWDSAFQAQFFRGIARAGMAVEQAFGGSQDVEGAWVGGTLHVVQTRPQVGSV